MNWKIHFINLMLMVQGHYYNYSYLYKNFSYLHHTNLDLFVNYNKQFVPQVEQREKEDWDCMVVPTLVGGLVSWRRREYLRNNQIHMADSSYRRGHTDLIPAFLNSHIFWSIISLIFFETSKIHYFVFKK